MISTQRCKNKKRIEILLKVIERLYSKNPGIQTLIDKLMIDICKGLSPEKVFAAFLCWWLYPYGLSKHKFCVCNKKKKKKKKNPVEFFDAGISRV